MNQLQDYKPVQTTILGHDIFYLMPPEKHNFDSFNLHKKDLFYDAINTSFLLPGEIRYVDIGARDGDSIIHLIPLRDRLKKITCFEPNDEEVELLKTNLRLNNLKADIFNFAITEKTDDFTFVWDSTTRNGGLKTDITKDLEQWDCEKTFKGVCWEDFDQALKDSLQDTNFIKVDTEGYDIPALTQLSSIIEKNKPLIQVEWFPNTEQSIINFCTTYNYIPYNIDTRNPVDWGRWIHNIFLLPR